MPDKWFLMLKYAYGLIDRKKTEYKLGTKIYILKRTNGNSLHKMRIGTKIKGER